MRPPLRTVAAWVVLLLAPLTWFIHFNALYGAASLAIVLAGEPGVTSRILMGVATLAALAVIAACYALAPRLAPEAEPVRRFWVSAARLTAVVSLVATLFQSLPALLVP